MNNLREIEHAIENLSTEELMAFRTWFADFEATDRPTVLEMRPDAQERSASPDCYAFVDENGIGHFD